MMNLVTKIIFIGMLLYLADDIKQFFDTSYLAMPLTSQHNGKEIIVQHWKMELVTQWLSTNSHHSCREGMLLLDELGHLGLATKLKAKRLLTSSKYEGVCLISDIDIS